MNIRVIAAIALVSLGFVNLGDGSATGLGLLAPLLPIAAITGHGGLFASGLSGVALLKLKAAAAIGALFALKKGGINVDFGWSNDDHGWHRRRRAATEADARGDTADLTDSPMFDPTLDEVLQHDQLGCGMRLVCELSASSYETLKDDEKLILELFGRDGKAPNPAKSSRGKLSYTYAAILGSNASDSKACARVYANCPYTVQQIMQTLREANI